MDWEKLKIFHAVAEAGSFTRAAKRLNLSQSALSRQIRGLEDSLNLSLFTRHARGLVLTQEGEQLFDTAHEVLDKIEKTERELIESKDQPRGLLKVTAPVTFGTVWLTPRMKTFLRLYPDIRLEFLLTDDDMDLATREADVAIWFHAPGQADLIQRQLGTVRQHIYGAPKYLSEKGTPERAEDLDGHDLISYGPSVPRPLKNVNWVLRAGYTGFRRKPVLQVNNMFGVLQALRVGIGLASIPDYLAAAHPELVRVLADIESPEFPTYFVYPGELKGSRRVRVFRDFLIGQIKEAGEMN